MTAKSKKSIETNSTNSLAEAILEYVREKAKFSSEKRGAFVYVSTIAMKVGHPNVAEVMGELMNLQADGKIVMTGINREDKEDDTYDVKMYVRPKLSGADRAERFRKALEERTGRRQRSFLLTDDELKKVRIFIKELRDAKSNATMT